MLGSYAGLQVVGTAPPFACVVDPYRSNLSLLLHFDGIDGSTSLTDSSPNPKSVLIGSRGDTNTRLSTSNFKYGNASLAMDGTGDYATTASHVDFNFPGDFAISQWVYPTASFNTMGLLGRRVMDTVGTGAWGTELKLGKFVFGDLNTPVTTVDFGAVPLNQWSRLVVWRTLGVIYGSINGVLSASTLTNSTNFTNTYALNIGVYQAAGGTTIDKYTSFFFGNFDEIAIWKGSHPFSSTNPGGEDLPYCNSGTAPPIIPTPAPTTVNATVFNATAGASAAMLGSIGPAPGLYVGIRPGNNSGYDFGQASSIRETSVYAYAQVLPPAAQPLGASYSVQYETFDGTALAGVDYTATSGTFTFTDNAPKLIAVPVLTSFDTDYGTPDKTFGIRLKSPVGASLLPGGSQILVTIKDDDLPTQWTWAPTTTPGNFGRFAEFKGTLNRAIWFPIRLQFSLSNGQGYGSSIIGDISDSYYSLDDGVTYTSFGDKRFFGGYVDFPAKATSIKIKITTTIDIISFGPAPEDICLFFIILSSTINDGMYAGYFVIPSAYKRLR